MTDQTTTSATAIAAEDPRVRASAAVFVIILGLFIAWGAAYANPDVLHNAAHDSRHALGFPCH